MSVSKFLLKKKQAYIREQALCDVPKGDHVSNHTRRNSQASDSVQQRFGFSQKIFGFVLFCFTGGRKQRAKYAVLEMSGASRTSSRARRFRSPGVKNKDVKVADVFKLGSLSTSPFQRLLFGGSQIHFQKGQTVAPSLTLKVRRWKGPIRDLHKRQTEISLPRPPPKKEEGAMSFDLHFLSQNFTEIKERKNNK